MQKALHEPPFRSRRYLPPDAIAVVALSGQQPGISKKRFSTKLPLAMKLTTIFLFAICLQVSGRSLAQTITFSGKNVSLEKVFRAIQRQTSYSIVCSAEMLENSRPVSIDCTGMPLERFLQQALEGQPFEYSIENTTIFISRKYPADALPAGRQGDKPETGFPSVKSLSSLIDIKGRVVNELGEPIAGASVIVRGTKKGATTDDNGAFEIKGIEENAVLVIRFIGFQSQELPVSNERNFLHRITLRQTVASLKDIVVTGLTIRKTESFTGSATTYSTEDLLEVGNANIVRSLANLDPSFRVLENLEFGSDPNRLPDIQLRGQTGLPDLNNEYGSNPNLPLFILDGFETTLQRVIDLDMYLVKRVTLLKDAASKSVYGSRAANGVVVIETKMPPPGKLQFSYNYNLNIETPDLSSYNLSNAREKLDVEMAADPVLNQAQPDGDALYAARQGYNRKLEQILRGVNTYWLSQPLRNGVGQRHSATIGGGTQEFRYNLELGYNNIAGVMKGSERNVYSGGVILNYRFRKLSVSNTFRMSSTRAENSPYGSFEQFALLNPYVELYDSTGSGYARNNPMWNGTVGVKDFAITNIIVNNLEVVWQPLTALRINGRLGLTGTGAASDVFLPATHNSFPEMAPPGNNGNPAYLPPVSGYGSYTKSVSDAKNLNATLMASYNRIFGKHNLYTNIGADANDVSREEYGFNVVGFPNPRLDFPAAAIRYGDNSKLNGSQMINRDMGVYGSANYAFNDRYLLDGTFRATRSSQFGKNDPWGKFWSVGVGWNLHHETFIKSLRIFNQLRLLANTGFTGTQALATYATLPTYSYNLAEVYYFSLAAGLQGLANPDLRAQRRQDNNFTLGAALFNNDLNIGVDYYISNTDGLLTDLNSPGSNGFTTFKANLGRAENRGFDIRVNYRKKITASPDNFISVYVTAGHNKNTLKEISASLIALTRQQDSISSKLPKVRFEEGQSLNAIWAVRSLGIDPATGGEVFLKKDGTRTYIWDVADQVVAGETLPKLFGNFGFSVRLNGWQFSSSFAYNLGGHKYNQTLVDKVENAPIALQNVDRRIFTSRWRKPGDITMFKSIADLSTTYPTTRFVQDWNEVSVASLNLSYDLERMQYVRSLGIKRLRASFIANNPMVLSSIQIERGAAYPFARTFSFSLQTNF